MSLGVWLSTASGISCINFAYFCIIASRCWNLPWQPQIHLYISKEWCGINVEISITWIGHATKYGNRHNARNSALGRHQRWAMPIARLSHRQPIAVAQISAINIVFSVSMTTCRWRLKKNSCLLADWCLQQTACRSSHLARTEESSESNVVNLPYYFHILHDCHSAKYETNMESAMLVAIILIVSSNLQLTQMMPCASTSVVVVVVVVNGDDSARCKTEMPASLPVDATINIVYFKLSLTS